MRRIRLLGFVVLAGACGRAGDGGGAAVTRDSAGIAIVENTGAPWTPGQEWKVIDSAVIDIGGDFDRVTGPVRLSSDSIMVSDFLVRRLTVLDSAGTFQRSFSLGGGAQSFSAPMAVPLGRVSVGAA